MHRPHTNPIPILLQFLNMIEGLQKMIKNILIGWMENRPPIGSLDPFQERCTSLQLKRDRIPTEKPGYASYPTLACKA